MAGQLGLSFEESNSAIQPLIIGSSSKDLLISDVLFKEGFFVGAIRPPTVPPNSARLRFTVAANHTLKQIDALLEKVNDAMA